MGRQSRALVICSKSEVMLPTLSTSGFVDGFRSLTGRGCELVKSRESRYLFGHQNDARLGKQLEMIRLALLDRIIAAKSF